MTKPPDWDEGDEPATIAELSADLLARRRQAAFDRQPARPSGDRPGLPCHDWEGEPTLVGRALPEVELPDNALDDWPAGCRAVVEETEWGAIRCGLQTAGFTVLCTACGGDDSVLVVLPGDIIDDAGKEE